MKLEDQVTSLDLSKKLKALGIKQKSLYWHCLDDKAYTITYLAYLSPALEFYSAFTASELADILPAFINIKENEPFNFFNLVIQKKFAKNIQYIANYHQDAYSANPFLNDKGTLFPHNIFDEKLSDCLAKTLIYIIENGWFKNENEI